MTRPPSDEAALRQRWILWFAMASSVFIYGVVGVFAVGAGAGNAVSLPVWLFPLLAFVIGGAAVFLHPRLVNQDEVRGGRRRDDALPVSPGELVVWSLDEAVAVLGLVTVFLTASVQSYALYGLVSLLLLWFHRPRG